MRLFLIVIALSFPSKTHGYNYLSLAKKMLWGEHYLTETETLRGAQDDPYYVRTFDDNELAIKIVFFDYFFKDDFDFSELGDFATLKKIYFKNCTFSKIAFQKFLNLFEQNLRIREFIGFSHVQLIDSTFYDLIQSIKKCRNLKKIRFVNNDFSENDVQELIMAISNKPIEKIVLEENLSNLSTIFLTRLLWEMPDLKHLSISWRQPYVIPFWKPLFAQDLSSVREYYFTQMIKALENMSYLKVLKLKCQDLYDSFDFNSITPHLTHYLKSDSARNNLKRFWFLASMQNHFPFDAQHLSFLPFNEPSSRNLLKSLPPQLESFKLSGLTLGEAFGLNAAQKRHLKHAKLSGKYKYEDAFSKKPRLIRYTKEKGIVYNQVSE